jgi:hypothetical protein
MITIPELAAETLGSHLAQRMGRRFGSTDAGLIELVQSVPELLSTVSATVTPSITTSSIRCW